MPDGDRLPRCQNSEVNRCARVRDLARCVQVDEALLLRIILQNRRYFQLIDDLQPHIVKPGAFDWPN